MGTFVVIFVPVLYDPALFRCGLHFVCLSDTSGLKSLAYWASQWGATYYFEGGYVSPSVGNLTTFGVLLTYAFPLCVAWMALLGPGITRLSAVARFSFAAFGAVTTFMSGLFMVSGLPELLILSVPLAPVGVVSTVYGLRIWAYANLD